ncbi:MAG: NEW3 domain-containing protein, partial [Candidatus Bipolaricaulota bacterium]
MAQYTKRPNRAALTFLLVGFFLLTLTFTARGQIDVSVVTPEREVPPNEFVSLTFSVTNESASEQQVSFDLSVPEDWSVMDEPAPRSVPAGGSTTIFLTIQVPATVKAADY